MRLNYTAGFLDKSGTPLPAPPLCFLALPDKMGGMVESGRLRDRIRVRMAELRIKDLPALATISGVPVRTINNILAGRNSRSRYAVELALGWTPGSIQSVLSGGEATVRAHESVGRSAQDVFVDTGLMPDQFDVEDASALPSQQDRAVIDAISNHPGLLPEAKEHLRNQFELLLRIASPATAATDPQPVETPATGDSRQKAAQARMGRLRADVRGQQRPDEERGRGTGTQGDG